LAKVKANLQKTVRYCCLQWRTGKYIDRYSSAEYIIQYNSYIFNEVLCVTFTAMFQVN